MSRHNATVEPVPGEPGPIPTDPDPTGPQPTEPGPLPPDPGEPGPEPEPAPVSTAVRAAAT